MKRWLYGTTAVLLLLAGCTSATQRPNAELLGRQATADFYAGHIGRVWSRFGPEMKRVTVTEAELADFQQFVRSQFGTEAAVLEERVTGNAYVRIATFDRARFPGRLSWVFAPNGEIVGFSVRAEVPDAAAVLSLK
jgi:hypothetical protein